MRELWNGVVPEALLAETATKACRFCACMKSPLCWAVTVGALGLLLLLPRTCCKAARICGMLFAFVSLGLFGAGLPIVDQAAIPQVVFWLLAAVTVGAAAAAIAMRSPVYTAIWFALSLVGTAGLFLYQGAQFLAVATIVVYAGAIVVTFLFVIMLANPEGQATYDRISWGWLPKPASVIASAAMVGLLTFAIGTLAKADLPQPTPEARANQVLNKDHMNSLGRELFGPHLISVEIAGTLLLVALVGAVAIVIQGKESAGGERPSQERPQS